MGPKQIVLSVSLEQLCKEVRTNQHQRVVRLPGIEKLMFSSSVR